MRAAHEEGDVDRGGGGVKQGTAYVEPPQTEAAGRKDRTVLVIGGAGYIGSVLVRDLLRRGYRVRVIDNLLYGHGSSLADLAEEPGFSFIRGDFCDNGVVDRSLRGVTDVVLLAALVGDPICRKYPELATRTNREGPAALFDLLHGRRIGKFIFASTCSNYGEMDDDGSADEERELKPLSLYAETKVHFENHIIRNAPRVDFCPVILRLSTAFGISRRMRFDLTVSEFTRALALRRELCVYDEDTWRPYCHVSDIAEAMLRVIESPSETVRGRVFNVGSRENNYTKKMLVDAVLAAVGGGTVRYQKGGADRRNYRVSFDAIQSRLGYRARFRIEDSVRALAAAIRNGLFDDVDSRKNFYGNHSIEARDPR